MLAGTVAPAYVDPFDLVCLGLGQAPATTDLDGDIGDYTSHARVLTKLWQGRGRIPRMLHAS